MKPSDGARLLLTLTERVEGSRMRLDEEKGGRWSMTRKGEGMRRKIKVCWKKWGGDRDYGRQDS
jgi:hypothetical protein